MAAIPAESSRPGHRRFRGGGSSGDSFWGAVVLLVFALALYWLAKSSLDLAGDSAGGKTVTSLAGLLISLVIVIAALTVYGRSPRTRSAAASVSFTIMKVMMMLSGVALLVEGVTGSINTGEFSQQMAIAFLTLFYEVTPLTLHITKR